MDVNTISALISSVGFPIVACGVMAWFCNKLVSDMGTKMDNLSNNIHDLLDEVRDLKEGE